MRPIPIRRFRQVECYRATPYECVLPLHTKTEESLQVVLSRLVAEEGLEPMNILAL